MTYIHMPAISSDLLIVERDILTRVAEGGPITDVLRDILPLVEKPSNGDMLASILVVSDDGKALWEGAAPSLLPRTMPPSMALRSVWGSGRAELPPLPGKLSS